MRKLPFILLFILVFCGSLFAQAEERVVCPTLQVAGPGHATRAGDTIAFTAQIDTFGREYKLEYRWFAEKFSDSPGNGQPTEIISGQGTPTILLKQIEEGITVRIEINGFPPDCVQVAYESAFVDPPPKTKTTKFSGNSRSLECPKIDISGPPGSIKLGDTIIFTATVEPAGKDLMYEWFISDGKIIEGQGTTSIKVEMPTRNDTVTATIEITGLPTGCPNVMSGTTPTICGPSHPKLLDEIASAITVKHTSQFETINLRLRKDPDSRLVIVLYSKNARQRAMDKRAILKYLRPPEDYRVTFIDGPDLGDGGSVKFWLVSAGDSDPEI